MTITLHEDQPSNTLAVQMDYARAVSTASLLPQAYRNKPADIMLAVGLGQSMGLSPAESLYRIDVIQGKPTASAELIAANVRKAGHRLRVETDARAMSVTCTIIRADDPEFPHTVTRDMEWAKGMGLATKDNYKKQPLTMLEWRAVSACARKACSEALYGVAYTSDEMADFPEVGRRTGGLAAAMATTTAEQVADESNADAITQAQLQKMGAAMREAGVISRDDALAYVADVIGRPVESRNDLSKDEASAVLDALAADTTPAPADEPASAE